MQINCPHCFTTNRLEKSQLGNHPNCGKCKKPIFTGKPMEINAGNVANTIQNNDIPVLVDCWAPWCQPCLFFAPIFEQAAAEFEPGLRLAKLNTQDVPSLGNAWQIQSIPTLILFKGGKEIQRISGAMPLPQLRQWIQKSGVLN
jgi:thioredoxin 2